MRLNTRLDTLEMALGQRPTATHKHARDLTDQELVAIIDGSDTTTRLITSPAEREALAKISDHDIQLIQKAVLAI